MIAPELVVAPPYRTRLAVLFARDEPRAVILRRGPKRHFRLIAWNTETDEFTPGQWMKGVIRLFDLSPDGSKLIYWAAQYHARAPRPIAPSVVPYEPLATGLNRRQAKSMRGRRLPRYLRSAFPDEGARRLGDTWTAISAPPYFTALAIWPAFGTWTGGGWFHADGRILLWETLDGLTPRWNTAPPDGVRFASAIEVHRAGHLVAPSAYNPALHETDEQKLLRVRLLDGGMDWVDWMDTRGDALTIGADGRIWRVADWRAVVAEDYVARAEPVADFGDMAFELIPPSEAALKW
jgi:hypothetical protein